MQKKMKGIAQKNTRECKKNAETVKKIWKM